MEERRGFVRLPARLDVTYAVLPSGLVQRTRSKDLSGGGLRLLMEQPLPAGSTLQLAVALPDREPPVNLTGEVVWSEESHLIGRSDRTRAVEVGVRAAEIAPGDRLAIEACVAETLRFGAQREA